MKQKIRIKNIIIASSIITVIALLVLFDYHRVNSDFERLKADLMRIRLKSITEDTVLTVKFDGNTVSVVEFFDGPLIESHVYSTISKVEYDTTVGKSRIVFCAGTTSMYNERIHGGEIALKSWFGFNKYIHVNYKGIAEEGRYPEELDEEKVKSIYLSDGLFPPAEYIQTKLQQNDIVFLGTTHKRPKILKFIAELIPTLKKYGVTHVGLEIPLDQQNNIDSFMETGQGLDNIRLHVQVDCPEYRNLFHVLRSVGGLEPVAIDQSFSLLHKNDTSRDECMAMELLKIANSETAAKMLVIVGNHHILKKLELQDHVPKKHPSIREYIQQEKPSIRMWSVGQLINDNPEECDFFRSYSSLPGSVALDVDERHRGWKLQYQYNIAILPAECFELVDGVIVY